MLLEIRGLRIEGQSDDVWHEIVKGIDLTLRRGEVLGLIGESGAGKSTIGLAAMGYARPGCRITAGTIIFDGIDLAQASRGREARALGRAHRLCRPVGRGLLQPCPPPHRAVCRDRRSTHRLVGASEGRARRGRSLPAPAACPIPRQIG